MGIQKTIVQKVHFFECKPFFHNVTVGLFVAENSVCDLLLIFMAIFTLFIFLLKHVKNKYKQDSKNRSVTSFIQIPPRWEGLDGDRWWAGLEHYTPGLKMDPTPALLLLHHDCTYFCHFYVYRVYLFKFW